MLAAIRAFAKSWVAKILLGILAISFVIWGGSRGGVAPKISDDVVKAASHSVRSAEFKRIFDGQLKEYSDKAGRQVTPEEAAQQGMDQYLLTQIAQANAIAELLTRLGVRPSDKLVSEQITKMQAFMDPVTRLFDRKAYQAKLQENGYTTAKFEAGLRDEIASGQFGAGISAGFKVPKVYGAVIASVVLQERDAAYFSVDPKMVGTIAPPTDAQLTQFLSENAAQLKRPEFRTISLVRFSAAAITQNMPVDDAAVQKQYELHKARLSVPEKRSFVQIQVKSPTEVQVVSARLGRGEDPAAIARSIGQQAIPYTDAQKSAIPDPKVAEAAFSMTEGQVSPVQGQFGAAVIKLIKITAGKGATLEEARPEIEKQLREASAREKVYADVEKYGAAHDGGANIDKAAQAAGATVYKLGPLTADGHDMRGQQVVGLTERMLKDAFSNPQGGETDLVDLGAGEYYALRVDRVQPSAVPPLAEIRAPLAQRWMQIETVKRMQTRADQLTAKLTAGQSIDAVAASVGAKVTRVVGVSQSNAQQHAQLGRDFLGKMTSVKAREAFTAQGPGFAISVAQVTAIRAPNPGNAAAIAQVAGQQLSQQMFDELRQMVTITGQSRVKPKIDRNKALSAIGVSPSAVAASGAAPSGSGAGGGRPLAQ